MSAQAQQTRPVGPKGDPAPVLVIAGTLGSDAPLAHEAANLLAAPWGGQDLSGAAVPFDQTDYYAPEMGGGLVRQFWCCAALMPAEQLATLKQSAWQIEQRLARDGQRRVNLDPGYLDATKVVLASFKPGPQKLYLGHGVWADMISFYRHGAFGPLPWTFPDLRAGPHVEFFARARGRYKERLRQSGASAA